MSAVSMLAPLSQLEAAEIEYATHPTADNERAWLDARKAADLAEAKARGLAHPAAADARRAAERAARASRSRLADVLKLARRIGPLLEEHAAWFGEQHVAAAKRVAAMNESIDTHNRLVREAHSLAAAMRDTEVEIPAEAYKWNAANLCGRAQRAALLAEGLRGVSDFFHESHE